MADNPKFSAKLKRTEKADTAKFDLSSLNLNYVNLVRELNDILETPNPKLRISKWWREKHFPYDLRRIDYITAYIQKINTANDAILNLQAKLTVNQEVLEMMIAGAFAEAERRAEIQLSEHKNALQKIEDEKEDRKLALQAKEIANLNAMAEVSLKNARTQQEIAKADLMKKAVDTFTELPESLRVYVVRALFNPNDKQEDDILLQEQVRDYLKIEKEAAAEKAKHEARKIAAQADVEEATAVDTVIKLKSKK